jgi:hypothetical protein
MCLNLGPESFFYEKESDAVRADGVDSHPSQERRRMGHPRYGELEKERERWATRPKSGEPAYRELMKKLEGWATRRVKIPRRVFF